MQRSRVTRIVAGLTLVAALAACGSSEKTGDKSANAGTGDTKGALIGVDMPTKSSERWIADGNNVKAALEKLGYKVSLQYAENSIPTQANQIETQISQGAKVLIVAAVDGTALTSQLDEAGSQASRSSPTTGSCATASRSTTTPASTTRRSARCRPTRC